MDRVVGKTDLPPPSPPAGVGGRCRWYWLLAGTLLVLLATAPFNCWVIGWYAPICNGWINLTYPVRRDRDAARALALAADPACRQFRNLGELCRYANEVADSPLREFLVAHAEHLQDTVEDGLWGDHLFNLIKDTIHEADGLPCYLSKDWIYLNGSWVVKGRRHARWLNLTILPEYWSSIQARRIDLFVQ
jgi:hypothetical protein